MKTAVIQLNAGGNKKRNIDTALKLVLRAASNGARFILLPEAFNYRGKRGPRKGYKDVAERIPGASIKPFMAVAKKHKVHILAGSICEAIPGSKKAYNTTILINASGRIAGNYRKINLFDARIGRKKLKESQRLKPGNRKVMTRVGPWTVGLSICYDLRFPSLYQWYARSGADVFCVPSAFTKITGTAHWEALLRARAIENLCYVLAPNQFGKDGQGVQSYGNSMIIDPWGNVLARASSNKEEIIYARLERSVLKKQRSILPGQGQKNLTKSLK